MIRSNHATPMTREGVSSPSELSREGAEAHAKRWGGPGTRSKNRDKYDKEAARREANR